MTRNHLEGITRLIAAGADVNKSENDGWSPIMMASEFGHQEAVQLLLDAGADVLQQTVQPHVCQLHNIYEYFLVDTFHYP